MTQLIGFNKYGDEYKLMGLAPYGKPMFKDEIKSKIFKNSNELFNLNLKYFNHHKLNFKYDISEDINIGDILSSDFKKFLENRLETKNINDFKKNISSSTQKIYEEYFQKILQHLKKINFSKNIIFSGGCALNSSANNILLNDSFFEKIFIPFAPADNGGAIGSSIYTYSKYGKRNRKYKITILRQ